MPRPDRPISHRPRRTRRPGRPPKYGSPSQVVAVTLPRDVVDALRRMNADIGWAIVALVERSHARARRATPATEAALVEIGGSQSLIVVNPDLFLSIPGVQMVPLSPTQAFLALEPGRGMADLEIAVLDRVEELGGDTPESSALLRLRDQLRRWRKDGALAFHSRSIILVTKAADKRRRATASTRV